MSDFRINGAEFHDLAAQILRAGHQLRFQANGRSMRPFILEGDILEVAPLSRRQIRGGDVVLVEANPGKLVAHRVIKTGSRQGHPIYLIKGDACASPDGWFGSKNILGRVEVIERGCRQILLTTPGQHLKAQMWVMFAPWATKFSWLPQQLRRRLRTWLLGSLISD